MLASHSENTSVLSPGAAEFPRDQQYRRIRNGTGICPSLQWLVTLTTPLVVCPCLPVYWRGLSGISSDAYPGCGRRDSKLQRTALVRRCAAE